MSNSSGFFVPLSSVVSPSLPSLLLRRAPPREVLDAGRSLLSPRGGVGGLTRGGRGVRDRIESALGLVDLLGPALDGLPREIVLATD